MKKLIGVLFAFGVSAAFASLNLDNVSTVSFPALDIHSMHKEDVLNEKLGNAPRFAVPREVNITAADGQWTETENGWKWRTRVTAAQAVSLNFAFTDFKLTPNAKLDIYSADLTERIRTFDSADNNMHNELWTPVIMANDVIIELTAPQSEIDSVRLSLTKVNQGYRTFAQTTEKSGSCNVDVVCSEGDDWRSEINSVAVISTGGSSFCTGFMVNNTSNDKTPYFMTAHHCRIRSHNAASLVTYWNYQTTSCGGSRDGAKQQFNTGSQWLAENRATDFTLVKLLKQPAPEANVTYAGFEARDIESNGATAIHHPNTDEKSISFEFDPVSTTTYLEEAVPGDGTHVRVTDWDVGTTEPGSSGSPLFNTEHRVIGQLHGGYASCSSQTSDWYGKLSVSWDNGLSEHLDSAGTGLKYADTLQ